MLGATFGSCSIGFFICGVLARGSGPKAHDFATRLALIQGGRKRPRSASFQGRRIPGTQHCAGTKFKFGSFRKICDPSVGTVGSIIKSHSIKSDESQNSESQGRRSVTGELCHLRNRPKDDSPLVNSGEKVFCGRADRILTEKTRIRLSCQKSGSREFRL